MRVVRFFCLLVAALGLIGSAALFAASRTKNPSSDYVRGLAMCSLGTGLGAAAVRLSIASRRP